jgi:3-methyladenine DNA glycosylase/8-oxoguanine DNA glycosylase
MTYTATKEKLTISVSEATDEKLRNLAFKHRKTHTISALAEAMILHCLSDRKFLDSLKKEEAIPY